MRDKVLITVILLIAFIVPFLLVTIIADSVCKVNGYYQQGINDEQGVYENN